MKKFAYIALSVLLTACSAANKENMAPAPEAVEEVMEKNVATVQFNDELTALVEEALAAGGLVTNAGCGAPGPWRREAGACIPACRRV